MFSPAFCLPFPADNSEIIYSDFYVSFSLIASVYHRILSLFHSDISLEILFEHFCKEDFLMRDYRHL